MLLERRSIREVVWHAVRNPESGYQGQVQGCIVLKMAAREVGGFASTHAHPNNKNEYMKGTRMQLGRVGRAGMGSGARDGTCEEGTFRNIHWSTL